MNRQEKEEFVADFHSKLERAQGTFVVDYQGLNVEVINRLRKELRKVGAEFQVVKNRLLKLACEETDTALVKDHLAGPSAITLTYEDVIGPAKILVEFDKDFEHFKIKSGQISGKVLDAPAIGRLAKLPGKDVLLAQAFSVMQAVPGSLVRVLNGLVAQLLNVLKAIEASKGQ
ncbi:MAG: 50S ribosomal protein L10 [Desulfobacteraceae bacterium]|nr:50S ribosomal protein L10 [Desulfobacteraceae bacterium]